MLITRFQKIKNHRIFRDYAWPGTGLPDFGRYNLIYGWNGAGKTTLSNIFRHLQRREAIAEGELAIVIDGNRTVTHADIPTATLPEIRVFNRDAIDRSIFEVAGRELPPVYYIGESSVKTQEEIEVLKRQLGEVLIDAGRAQDKHTKLRDELEKYRSEQAKSIKNLLTASGSAYNNYNATDFRSRAEQLLKLSTVARLAQSEKTKLISTIRSVAMDKIVRPPACYPDLVKLNERVLDILQRSVVSSVIDDLCNNPEVGQWVAHGLDLHRGEHTSSNCRFCTQPMPTGRLHELEGHFNNAYARFQDEVSVLIEENAAAMKLVSQPVLPNAGLLYPELRESYAAQVLKFSQHGHLAGTFLTAVQRALTAKQKEPFRKLDFLPFFVSDISNDEPSGLMTFLQGLLAVGTGAAAFFGKAGFDAACGLIDQHNAQTVSFERVQKSARRSLEDDCVVEVLDAYRAKLAALESADGKRNTANTMHGRLVKKIAELEKDIRHHHPAAEELTKDMVAYLGRDELRFEARDAGYVISRHGKPAMHLSEGERTAIAFMYFLKSLQDASFDLKNGIVVIDDPVSSLDANSLYCAFGFMKSRIQDAKQIFVLTHNFTFFRQVKNWFDYKANGRAKSKAKPQSLKDVRYYMLKSRTTEHGRGASICALDDLLYQYESEYHHMFKLVLEASKEPDDVPMSNFYSLPNISRRLLEAVLAFKQPEKTGELYQQIRDISFDEAKKARIIRFTNTYSHHGLMPEPVHDLSVLAEAPLVMRNVLELVEFLDKSHFDSMRELCGVSGENAVATEVGGV